MKTSAQERERKQLEKFRRMQAQRDYRGYFIVMIALVMLFQLFDQMTTNIFGTMQEAIIKDFAGLAYNADITVGSAGYKSYQDTLSTITFTNIAGYAFLGILPWYKSLADKLGRKPFFVINALFLGVAMFVGGLTHKLTVFVIASLVIVFFTLHDMQILYITECVPDNKRATWQGIIAAVGSVAGISTASMRMMDMSANGTEGQIPWREIYIIIGIFGLLIFVVSALLLRESRPFLNSRIAYLETLPEVREAQAKAGKANQAGVISGIKLILKNKQLFWLSVATLIFSAANNMVCSYNNTIMAQNGLDTFGITVALIVTQVVAIPINLFTGPIADKIGRKWGAVISGLISAVGFAAMVYGAPLVHTRMSGGIFCGITSGLAICGYLSVMNLTTLMMSESCPSTMRSTVIGVRSFFQVSAVASMAVSGFLFRILPTGQVCFILAVPFLLAGSLCLMMKTKETRNLTMEEIDSQFK